MQSRTGAIAAQTGGRYCRNSSTDSPPIRRLHGINTFFRPNVPQLRVEVDREKALALGVPVNEVFDALQSTMSALYVNDFNVYGRTFRVQMQAEAPFRNDPERSRQGLRALADQRRDDSAQGADAGQRDRRARAARTLQRLHRSEVWSAPRANGVSSGDAIRAVEEVAQATLPEGYQIAWTGQAFQEKRTGSASVFAFVFAIVMVFLILAALYGRWLLPISVLLAVPFAVLGALGFVALRGMENDIYFQIGLVVLIGLAAKNAILIVEFAQRGVLEGRIADRSCQGSRAPAFPPDRHDVARIRARRRAARGRDRRRRGCASIHGHRRVRRHDPRDVRAPRCSCRCSSCCVAAPQGNAHAAETTLPGDGAAMKRRCDTKDSRQPHAHGSSLRGANN